MTFADALTKLCLNPLDDEAFQLCVKTLARLQHSAKTDHLLALEKIFQDLLDHKTSWLDLEDLLQPFLAQDPIPGYDIEVQARQKNKVLFDDIKDDNIDNDLAVTFFEECEENINLITSSLSSFSSKNAASIDWNALFRAVHTLKGSSASVGFKKFSAAVHAFEDFLSIQRENLSLEDVHDITVPLYTHVLQKTLQLLAEDPYVHEILKTLYDLAQVIRNGEILTSELEKNCQNILDKKIEKSRENLKISVEKINQIFGSVEGLHSYLTQLENNIHALKKDLTPSKDENLTHTLDLINTSKSIASSLQKDLIRIRLVPFQTIQPRVSKVVDQYLASSGKDISFKFIGGRIGIRKTVLDRLTDIILHLVKNSLDHGIEQTGILELKAQIVRSRIQICIADNGKGIDGRIIAQKAYEKGLISQQNLNSMSPKEQRDLIFLPGFSTAEKVSETSGRGVGMDAVKRMVADLGGQLSMHSEPGQGTRMTLYFHTDLSVEDVVMVSSNQQQYAILLSDIDAIISINSTDMVDLSQHPFYETQQHLIPVQDLAIHLGGASSLSSCTGLLLLRSEYGPSAWLVEQVTSKTQVIATPPPAIYQELPYISGIFTTPEGQVCALLHPQDLPTFQQAIHMKKDAA